LNTTARNFLARFQQEGNDPPGVLDSDLLP
jgi:hypothetical protein